LVRNSNGISIAGAYRAGCLAVATTPAMRMAVAIAASARCRATLVSLPQDASR
jgi:hypothetical protein